MTDKPSDDRNSLIGRTVDNGRYEITRLIGEGGMGHVYEARQVSMDRRVALKILRAQLATDEQLLARFQQEALSISRLRHPNSITIFDYGKTEDDLLFMSMELLGGTSLFSVLRKERQLSLPRTLHILDQVAGAVAEAHQLGIVHRDLKPENIQIDHVGGDSDFAKVLDFGIAKILGGDGRTSDGRTLTLAGSIFGTPHYMSPEQVHGQKVDHRTDIYSLGIILFEMLAGKPPFDGNTPMAVMMAQANKPLPDIREVSPEADVNDAVIQLIEDCCVKDRARRLRTAEELITRLRQLQIELGEINSTNSRLYLAPPSGVYRASSPPANDTVDRTGGRANTAPVPRIPLPEEGQRNSGEASIAPEHAGHLATQPPANPYRSTDPNALEPLNAGRSRWIALFVGLVALGVGLAMWSTTDPPPKPTDPDDTPGKIAIVAQMIRYTVDSRPQGATVFLKGTNVGQTPLELDLPRGEANELSIQLEGHTEARLLLDGEGASPVQKLPPVLLDALKPPAAPTPKTAWVKLVSEPSAVDVYLGEDKIGTTPFEWTPELVEGPIELRFSKEGYQDLKQAIELAPKAEAPVDVMGKMIAVAPEKPTVKRPGRRSGRRNNGTQTPKNPGTPANPTKPGGDTSPYEKL